MKSVRKDLLETAVMNAVLGLLNDDDMIEYITLLVWKYYEKTTVKDDRLTVLNANLKEINRRISNIVNNIENGMPYDLVKSRLTTLREEEATLSKEIATLELKESVRLTESHIRYYLYGLREKSINDAKCQKQIFDTFVNQILLYDNKAVIALNYSGDANSITVNDIKKINEPLEEVRLLSNKQGKGDEKQTIKIIGLIKKSFLIEIKLGNKSQ